VASWTVLAVALVSSLGAVAIRRLIGVRTAFATGAVVTLAVLAAMASQPGAAERDYAAPLTVGTAVRQQLVPLIAWRATG